MTYNHKVPGVARWSSWACTTMVKSLALRKPFQISVSAVKLRSFACPGIRELPTFRKCCACLRVCGQCHRPATEQLSQKEMCTAPRCWNGTRCVMHLTHSGRQRDRELPSPEAMQNLWQACLNGCPGGCMNATEMLSMRHAEKGHHGGWCPWLFLYKQHQHQPLSQPTNSFCKWWLSVTLEFPISEKAAGRGGCRWGRQLRAGHPLV